MILFIDSKPGGVSSTPTNLITSGGEEGSINNMAVLTFQSDFNPDFTLSFQGAGSDAYINRHDFNAGSRD